MARSTAPPRGETHGYGTVFAVSPDGTGYNVLHSFTDGSDIVSVDEGANPGAALKEASDGILYGTASAGVTGGSVFKLSKDGAGFAVLHFFGGSREDINPEAPLIEGSDRALYGTTYGANGGEVFKLDKDGASFTVLRVFAPAGGDAAKLSGALVDGPGGVLYATSERAGWQRRGRRCVQVE